jgi:hypothetical protein
MRAAEVAIVVADHRITGILQGPEVPVDGFTPRPESPGQVMYRGPRAFQKGTEYPENPDDLPVPSL